MSPTVRRSVEPITVAVASRDRVYLESLSASLAQGGLAVRVLASFEEAASTVTLEGVDVLLLDTESLGAPDLDLAAAMQHANPLVEVVALAGSSTVADAVKALRAGVFTVLQHPVADGLLVEALLAAGRRHRRACQRLEELNGSGPRSRPARTPARERRGKVEP